MEIIESFICGKRNDPSRCEDGFTVTTDYAAVVDGSTSKLRPGEKTPYPDRSTGRVAMETVLAAVWELPPAATPDEVLDMLTAALHRVWTPAAESHPWLRPTCSLALLSRAKREVWLVGDCQCRTGSRTVHPEKAVDSTLATIRADVVRWHLAHGATTDELLRDDPGRRFIADALRLQTWFQNALEADNPWRYPVLDGTSVRPADVVRVPVRPGDHVTLATDGYPALCDTLAETEAHLSALLTTDPLCVGPLRSTKGCYTGQVSYDDRTYLTVNL